MRPHYGPGVDLAFDRSEYQEYFLGCKGGRCVGLITLPPSFADCLEIWEIQLAGTLRAYPGLYRDYFTLLFYQIYFKKVDAIVRIFVFSSFCKFE